MQSQPISSNTSNNVATRFQISQNVSRASFIGIVSMIDGEAVTTTLAIAKGCKVDHASVIKLVRTYQADLEEFGLLDFKSESTGGRPTEFALLNEQQSTLIMTYMRNGPVVREFKKTLVKAFWSLVRGQSFSVPQTRADALRLAADLEEQNVALAIENHQQAEKIASLESIFQVGMTPTQFCKRLNGVNCQQINNALLARNWIYNAERDSKRSVKYRVGCQARDKYLTERVTTIEQEGKDPFLKYTPVLLKDGAKRLHNLYMKQKLPMKAAWNGEFCHIKATLEAAV
ncbi:phage regulator Rha-like protein [Pseudomonas sp. GGS8]|uniref:Rha family transcriptional regulator n=1 Tax=Pseudomonas sp. GGS8 TaxID=2817892 RepID=UPI00209E6075|nr:Rha family transcriptional regulator [Pseudomonas sp. GGS8]MCP1446420.1 phage regulator Rha-like protein [Pseudomonas sp. GGS8]